MDLKSWLQGLDCELIQGTEEREVTDVVYDSRKAKAGDVFVCMKGTKIDSHSFIPAVLEQGVKVLVAEVPVTVPEDITVIKVTDSRAALAHLSAARFGNPARKMIMVGVTGTKGKTTTTHMMKMILEASGKKTGMIGTNGVLIGESRFPTVNTTPESYQLHEYFDRMVREGCECCVMEVSSQALKMHRVDGIVFDYAVFTNISHDHIGPDEHENFEEYLSCKKSLFQQAKQAFINRDDERFDEIVRDLPCAWESFGIGGEGGIAASDIRYVAEPDFVGLEFTINARPAERIRVSIPGRFNVYNALAALTVCDSMGLPAERVRHALEHLQIDGRMEIVHKSARCCVIVDYAHNEVSMESLLRTLRNYNSKRLVCVFGCGGNRSRDRRYSMGEIAGKMADFSIITADNSRFEKIEDIIADIRGSIAKTGGTFIEIPDRREAIAYSITHARPGDMIAVIGKGHEDYQEIEGVRYPFLDRAVVREVIDEMRKQNLEP